MRKVFFLFLIALVAALIVQQATGTSRAASNRSLDGRGNNVRHPDWGRAGTQYLRLAPPAYADGISAMEPGPSPRYISNRIFNDLGQNIFSENDVTQWAWAWGQFIDHDIGLRNETPGESAPIAFNSRDTLESFKNDLGRIDFARTPAAPGTGRTTARQQINTLSSFIDGSNVYGVDSARTSWLRAGPLNHSGANLMLPGGYLPLVSARGNVKTAPKMDLFGMEMGAPAIAVVAGDVRANENIALTAIQTLFAREHNRIVASLPASLSPSAKFDIARRIVGAEIQYITYTEFLPSLGVSLAPYRGYDATVNPSISDEFATVGYRGHSMVHGQFDVSFSFGQYSGAQLLRLQNEGIGVAEEDGAQSLQIPLTVAYGNPGLVEQVGLGPLLRSLGAERQYRNDEQVDNTLRSVLFEVPKPGVTDPAACQEPVVDPRCFSMVQDLAAIDIQRARDHGIPSYNDLRRAYGLAPQTSFTEITGESTDRFPASLGPDPIDNPKSLGFVRLLDKNGHAVTPGTSAALEQVVTGVRRSTLAARLRAIYGSVDKVDAFVGMLSEPHVRGTEFGELQLAMWKRQFTALRDGDRFFYENDPVLRQLTKSYSVTYAHSLAQIITLDTGTTVQPDVFKVSASTAEQPAAAPAPAPTPQSSRRVTAASEGHAVAASREPEAYRAASAEVVSLSGRRRTAISRL